MVFDLHCDTIMRICNDGGLLKKNEYHIDVEKMLKGKSVAQFFAMFVPLEHVDDPYVTCNDMIDVYQREVKANPELAFALTYDMYLKNKEAGKISSILTIEEGATIQGSLDKLQHFYDRGVRSITLTWNYENEIGSPNTKFPEKGLTPFGIEVVKKMNELGMLVDVSHLSDGGFWDCIKHSSQPIIASHSNARGLCDVTRNLTDDMILALRDNGGVMGMNFCSYFLDKSEVSKLDDIVKHINYIRDLAGIEVIALGSDFDGIGGELELKDMSYLPNLRIALKDEGYKDEEIDMVFYKNAERVIKKVLG